jgi:putative intracellular protease/amidase
MHACIRSSFAVAALFFNVVIAAVADSPNGSRECYYLPGDPQWPNAQKWQQLNDTVGGRLIGAKPLAEICHGPDYNPEACNELKPHWTEIPRQ